MNEREEYNAAFEGRIGADRIALGLPIIPNMQTDLPWPERVAMLSINPDAASSADVAQLASDLMNCHQQDRLKTREINVLVKENNKLRSALKGLVKQYRSDEIEAFNIALTKAESALGAHAP